jgi:hypothetical protein
MIHAKDLRLGNLITWNPKLSNPQITLLPMQVEIAVLAEDKIGYTPYKLEQRVEPFEDARMIQMETIFKPLEDFEPITLTTEVLERIGFENSNGGFRLSGFYPQLFLKGNVWIADLVPDTSCVELKYLHQLQNLYYTILGEELEISL